MFLYLLVAIYYLLISGISYVSYLRYSPISQDYFYLFSKYSESVGLFAFFLLFFMILVYAVIPLFLKDFSLKKIFYFLVPILIILYFTIPFFSSDLVGYLIVGKNMNIMKHDPYIVNKNAFNQNEWRNYLDAFWMDQPTFAGPLYLLINKVAAFNNSILVSIFVVKSFHLVGYLVSLYYFNKIREVLNLKIVSVFYFAFNPAILIHTVMDGHGETFMILFLLMGILSFFNNKYSRSAINFALAISLKFYYIVLSPIFFLEKKRINFKNTVLFLLSTTIILLVTSYLVGITDITHILNNPHFYSDGCFLKCTPFIGLTNLFGKFSKIVRYVSFFSIALFLIYKYIYNDQKIVKYSLWILLTLMFVYVSNLAPWYLLPTITLCYLVGEKRYTLMGHALAFYSIFHLFGI